MNVESTLNVTDSQVSPVLPAALSTMLPGLGQVYNRELGKGLVVFFLSFLIIPYIYGIFDAYFTARANNRSRLAAPRPVAYLPAPKPKSLELQLIEAARAHGGELSVVEGSMATGASLEEVEAQLDAMCVKGYVDIGNRADTGAVVYCFG